MLATGVPLKPLEHLTLNRNEILAHILNPERQAKMKAAAEKVFELTNQRLGLQTSLNVTASVGGQRITSQSLESALKELHRLEKERIGSTLHADAWKKFRETTWK